MYQEQEGIRELEQNGIYIENVCSTEKSGTFFLCLSKALIMFLVCIGTVTGFCDAFEMPYNKPVIIIYTLATSLLAAFLFYRKKSIYIGVSVITILVIFGISQTSICFSGGLRAISDIIREAYAKHYHQYLQDTPNPYYTDDYVSITVVLIFVIASLLILYSITIVRYMSFAETFAISFIFLEIPMFIGKRPGLLSLALIMAGCIAVGLLGHGSFNNINLPFKKTPDYTRENGYRKTKFTTVGSYKGILAVLIFAAVFTLAMLVFSIATYNDNAPKTKESDLKVFLDEKAEIVAVHGVPALLDEIAEPVYVGKGELGKVDKIENDNGVDLAVTFVPYTSKTMYLPGFWGVRYRNMQWYDSIKTADYPDLGFDEVEYIEANTLNGLAKQMTSKALRGDSPTARIQITYLDNKFDNYILPYYNPMMEWVTKTYYNPKADKDGTVPEYETRQAQFIVPDSAQYYNAENTYLGIGIYGYESNLKMASVTVPGTKKLVLYGSEFIDQVCLDVPEELDAYLEEFISAHDNFGVEKPEEMPEEETENKNEEYYIKDRVDGGLEPPLTTIPDGVMDVIKDDMENGGGKVKIIVSDVYGNAYEITMDRYAGIVDGMISSNPPISDPYSSYTTIYDQKEKQRKKYEQYEKENEYRLKVCEAIKDMFAREYLYSRTPGKTPPAEDYVRYFLESQKQGVCTHFASAAVMLLRHMGIPARYVEGYCLPSSLVKKNGKAVTLEGDINDWYMGENTYNPKMKALTVEVTDFYAHAWIEVYLEGKGFVPFEMTPAAYVQAPLTEETIESVAKPATVTQAVNKPTSKPDTSAKATTAPAKDDSNNNSSNNNNSGSNTTKKTEHIETDTERVLKILLFAVGTGVLVWLSLIILKRALRQLRISGYIKRGKYKRVIYIRYCELVERLKRKNIVTVPNPLPMELCGIISGYVASEEADAHKDISGKPKDIEYEKVYKRVYCAYSGVFSYLEKVLYGGYETNASEYNDFYGKISILK